MVEMDEKRSSRNKKLINYATFSTTGNEDTDDDFADSTPPTRKAVNLKQKQKKQKGKGQEKDDGDKKKSHHRGTAEKPDSVLPRALELSVQEESSRQSSEAVTDDTSNAGSISSEQNAKEERCDKVPEAAKVKNDITDAEADYISPRKRRRAAAEAVAKQRLYAIGDDEDDDVTDFTSYKNRQTRKKLKTADADEDFDVEADYKLEEDDEDEDGNLTFDEEDVEEEFSEPKERSRGRTIVKRVVSSPKPRPRSTATVIPPALSKTDSKLPGKSKSQIMKPFVPDITVSSRSSSSGGTLFIRKPSWLSPGPKDTGKQSNSRKSSGVLRLGLSRKANVKPLHASLKSVH